MSFLIIIGVYLFYPVEKTGQDWVNERENDRSCELFALKDGYQFVDHEEQKKYYYDKEGRVFYDQRNFHGYEEKIKENQILIEEIRVFEDNY